MLSVLRKFAHTCVQVYPSPRIRRSSSVKEVLSLPNVTKSCYRLCSTTAFSPQCARPCPSHPSPTVKRTLSTLQDQQDQSSTSTQDVIGVDESQQFMDAFPDIRKHLQTYIEVYDKGNEASKWFLEALNYNLPKGKKNRGLLTVLAYKNLVKDNEVTEERLRQAQILGWCVEMLQCFFLLCDDVMDNSSTRRGQLCWHKLENVGLIAINDALMMENVIYSLLKHHFRNMNCYVDIMELFHEITFITTCGQSLDLIQSRNNVSSFTMTDYRTLVANKTSYYTFYLPVVLAMHLAGGCCSDLKRLERCRPMLLQMGELFQIQDDFLDCFGDESVTGKIGTDIQENKCTWLAVKCMELANDQQRQWMSSIYGGEDLEQVEQIKGLYRLLDLPGHYSRYESELYKSINQQIDEMQNDPYLPSETFRKILNKIYHRKS